ncbi:protein phosphatase [Bradyrhizobium japonicum]|uniref:PP2C family protein-serine/threonine phosphatase n=1 Tax=Bradyrhizobium japonicum TaxID=375 RepID=UPI002168FA84|nr:PP2C family serine/threonine-protein phosphatase [Bradyrhizobium japonicum]MCS3498682.1 protein phosphatase [Bradyrhizobium japonicum]MCS3959156.1 protein phosphatase [Bradyrhizobium japonicum]MCS4000911.1 protein phosphatase [Bradyrhizobium japonicum]
MPSWTISAFTHRGRVRPNNEDAIAIDSRVLTGDMDVPIIMTSPDDCCLLMIADGMGGHAHGAMASRAVLDYLVAATDRLLNPASCAEAIEEANRHLYELMREHEEALAMGSTLVGAILTASQLLTFNVGDSRCYLLSRGQLVQLSHDDVPEGESRHIGSRRSHVLTQALGGSSFPIAVEPHISVDPPLAPGETLLLCSDGLTDMVTSEVIGSTLRTASDPLQVARKLAGKAFNGGARDNISLLVVRSSDSPAASQS